MLTVNPLQWNMNKDEVLISITIVFFNVFGLFGNSNLIWATVRNKELRNKHGQLMMFFCILHNVCLISEFGYILLNISDEAIDRKNCFKFAFVHVVASCLQAGMSLVISIDLLIAMIFPFQHRFFSVSRYVFLMTLPCWIYSFFIAIWGMFEADDAQIPFCNPPLAMAPSVGHWWVITNITINCATIAVYSVLYTLILKNGNRSEKKLRRVYSDRRAHKAMITEKKILRSLTVVIAVYVLSWFLYILGNAIASDSHFGLRIKQNIQGYLIIFALICHSQNYYVTFFLSQSYRRAFMEQIYLLTCREVPERFWPISATASRMASQYWQRSRSEIFTVAGTLTPHNQSVKSLPPRRKTSSLPELSKIARSHTIK